MRRDGNGWVRADNGRRFWGRYGAAGLLLVAPSSNLSQNLSPNQDGISILLQHRALWTAHGNTWSLPGGAIDSHETPAATALREAPGIDPAQVTITGSVVTSAPSGTDWTYTTVIATTEALLPVTASLEGQLRWVPEADVAHLRLHPDFAASWPQLRKILHAISVH